LKKFLGHLGLSLILATCVEAILSNTPVKSSIVVDFTLVFLDKLAFRMGFFLIFAFLFFIGWRRGSSWRATA
jgi:hypothetical protein